MKSRPLLFVALFLLFACAIVGGALYSRFGKKPTATQPAPAVMAHAGETATASPAPTVDYSAVWPAETQAAAQSTNSAAIQKQADAESTKASAASTVVSAEQTSIANDQLPGTPTAIMMITQQAIKTENAQATKVQGAMLTHNGNLTATASATVAAQERQANTKTGLLFIGAVVVAIGVLMALRYGLPVLFRVLDRNDYDRRGYAEKAEPAPEISSTELPADAQKQRGFVRVGDSSFHAANPPVTDRRFRMWAEAMLNGETAGINKWETAERFGSAVSYQPLLEWAEGREYIEVKSGAKVLSETGIDFCRGWLARHSAENVQSV